MMAKGFQYEEFDEAVMQVLNHFLCSEVREGLIMAQNVRACG
jgi:hypothetical protein